MNPFLVILCYFDQSSASVSTFYGIGLSIPTLIGISSTSLEATKKSLNEFCFLWILDDFRALCLTAALYSFDNQKNCQKCDPLRPSRMILLNP